MTKTGALRLPSRLTSTRSIQNAMTIDVEDYFHVNGFSHVIDRADWSSFPSHVAANTHTLLDVFARTNTKVTFFTLGCVAEAQPDLIRRIVGEGHELASHGWAHWRVYEQDRETFQEDVRRTRLMLEDIGGTKVIGYRAASFSINEDTPWAYDVLREAGYTYSSSSHPIKHDHYGDANAPRTPWRDTRSEIVEIPITTGLIGKRRFPAGGGGFFRLLPLWWFKRSIQKANSGGLVANFYLHPWEIDPDQPRIKAVPLRSRLRHYTGLSGCKAKLTRLLACFAWTRMDVAYASCLDGQMKAGMEWNQSPSATFTPVLKAEE